MRIDNPPSSNASDNDNLLSSAVYNFGNTTINYAHNFIGYCMTFVGEEKNPQEEHKLTKVRDSISSMQQNLRLFAPKYYIPKSFINKYEMYVTKQEQLGTCSEAAQSIVVATQFLNALHGIHVHAQQYHLVWQGNPIPKKPTPDHVVAELNCLGISQPLIVDAHPNMEKCYWKSDQDIHLQNFAVDRLANKKNTIKFSLMSANETAKLYRLEKTPINSNDIGERLNLLDLKEVLPVVIEDIKRLQKVFIQAREELTVNGTKQKSPYFKNILKEIDSSITACKTNLKVLLTLQETIENQLKDINPNLYTIRLRDIPYIEYHNVNASVAKKLSDVVSLLETQVEEVLACLENMPNAATTKTSFFGCLTPTYNCAPLQNAKAMINDYLKKSRILLRKSDVDALKMAEEKA